MWDMELVNNASHHPNLTPAKTWLWTSQPSPGPSTTSSTLNLALTLSIQVSIDQKLIAAQNEVSAAAQEHAQGDPLSLSPYA